MQAFFDSLSCVPQLLLRDMASPQHVQERKPCKFWYVYVAGGIFSGRKQSLSPEGTVQHFYRVKPHRSAFSWERGGSSSCLCHAAAAMSTLLAGGSSTAASSSLLNLKLCCLLLPFYSFLKHRQKKLCLFLQNKYLLYSFSRKKKLLASQKQHRKLNSKQEDLSQFSRAWTEQPPSV